MREKGSRFLALLRPVENEAAAETLIADLERRHRDARHHCWAWRLGDPPRERYSDAGEPAGTAGMPILLALRGGQLSDALVLVVRWFGGTKLGKGGLARAYGQAACQVVERAARRRRVPVTHLEVELSYERLGALQGLLQPPKVALMRQDYGEEARLVLRVRIDALDELRERLAELGIKVRKVGEAPPELSAGRPDQKT